MSNDFFNSSQRFFWLLIGFLGAVGCSGEARLATYPVRGKVTFRSQPVAEAMLVLHPVVPFPAGTPQPVAFANAQGEFEFTTFKNGDGAPKGQYVLTVELRDQRQVGEELVRDGRNLLPARYQSPQTSNLKCEVKAGANELPPVVLAAESRSLRTSNPVRSTLLAMTAIERAPPNERGASSYVENELRESLSVMGGWPLSESNISVALSPNGKWLVVGSQVWDLKAGILP